MANFQWNSLFQEMSDRCSFLRDVFVTAAKCRNKYRDPEMPICLCYSILLQQRNHDLTELGLEDQSYIAGRREREENDN